MTGFTVRADTALSPAAAWAAVTDWAEHSRLVPLTRVWADGDRVTARTSLGPLHLDDVMLVQVSEPPTARQAGRLQLVKTGGVHGTATIEVAARPDGGARVRWQETARLGPRWFRRACGPVQDAVGRAAFGLLLRRLLRAAESRAARTGPAGQVR